MNFLSNFKEIYNLVVENGIVDFWICDYRIRQSGNLKLRDILPIKMRAIKIMDRPSQFRNSECERYLKFYPYTKTGKISKNPVELYSGEQYDYIGAYIFLTEDEAIEQYNNCIWEKIKLYESEISELQERKLKLENKFINTDIVMETLVRN